MESALGILRYLFVTTVMGGGAYVAYLLVRLAREKSGVTAPKDDA